MVLVMNMSLSIFSRLLSCHFTLSSRAGFRLVGQPIIQKSFLFIHYDGTIAVRYTGIKREMIEYLAF